MKIQLRLRLLFWSLLLAILAVGGVSAQEAPTLPDLVVIPGTIQSVLGCPGDWQPDCEATALVYDEVDGIYSATFTLPAGSYEYKAALNGSWDVNYGAGAEQNGANIQLTLEEETDVRFIYNPRSNWVTDSVNSLIANVPGNYQSEIGCPNDWEPGCLQSLLEDIDGDGIYTYVSPGLPAGPYEAKVALNESWSLNYGAEGRRDGANILFVVQEDNQTVEFQFDSSSNIMTILVGGEAGPAVGNLFMSIGQWVTADTILWNIGRIPGATYTLHWSPEGALDLTDAGITGGESIVLTYDRDGMTEDIIRDFPHLADDYFALRISPEDLPRVPEIVRSQVAIQATYNTENILQDATSVQINGVLDDRFATDAPLGVTWADGVPTLSVWAPTASNVRLHLFADADPATEASVLDMTRADDGVWSITGDAGWNYQYYLYEVTVYTPAERRVVTNLVTDPYSFSLSLNSERSQIVDLNDPALFPEGWAERPALDVAAPEDIVLYELHVRDFSIIDQTVPEDLRGTFAAFTVTDSAGMQYLRGLAEAGLTHVHILPAFDFATTNENRAERQEADRAVLAALPPDSEEQQALVGELRGDDGFNWGYDPQHYTVPEGSYSTDPNGAQRIREFRAMVQALNSIGLRVVMDVVYNHTNAAGQADNSVLDRIVPGYYHRLSLDGRVETSTCCPNTATERGMMERLMIDSVLTWTTEYGVDGYRFDLMGHHMLDNMTNLRAALDALTVDADGVDGRMVYVYGEGWNFGEVADDARGVNARQLNLGGTGIGSFTDRLRDAVRGGSPFGGWQEQGFGNGLYTFPNEVETRDAEAQLELLYHFQDQIRLGLAGNLAEFTLTLEDGTVVTGNEVDYNGQPAGYALDPQETITYVSAHDNEAIWDAIQMKAPLAADSAMRIRMHNLSLSLVAFSQGVPFFHAGDELLRSKSLDRNSYDSGDWYNAIDWTGAESNWGHGLPPAWNNQDNWPIFQPLLANPDLATTADQRLEASAVFREFLTIRRDSPLFRLRTAQDVFDRVIVEPSGIPGVIVLRISDEVGADLDPNYRGIVVVFNASPGDQEIILPGMDGYVLHPVQVNSVDPVVRTASFADSGFSVPALTTAVFVLPQ